jgi:hypothetical protein
MGPFFCYDEHMLDFIKKHRRIFSGIFSLFSLVVAAIYLYFVPAEINEVSGIHRYILLYGHSLCWILLFLASLAWGVKRDSGASKYFAYSALAVYVVFITSLLFTYV